MSVYAQNSRQRRRSPAALTLIIAGHAAAIALLASAQMEVGVFAKPEIPDAFDVPLIPPEPVPEPPKPQPKAEVRPDNPLPPPPDSFIDQRPPIVPLPDAGPSFDLGPASNSVVPDIGPIIDTPVGPPAKADPPVSPPAAPVRVAARPITPTDLLRPPYPDSKARTEEEGVLRLRLVIDARGRVTAVEPVGAADPAFLAAARSHLIRHWRYRAATEDGRAVASTLVITLRFELED